VWSPSNRRTAFIGRSLWINGRRVAIAAGVYIDPAASGWISETTIAYACGRPARR
jgi:hypothetical protein